MGVKERYEKRQASSEKKLYNGVKTRWIAKNIDSIAQGLSNKVNSWLDSTNNFYSSYENRFSGRKGTYEDSYVSDSGAWLKSLNKQREALEKERESIRSALTEYGDYLDEKWVSEVGKALDSGSSGFEQVLQAAKSDDDYWKQFGSREGYDAWAKFQKEYDGKLAVKNNKDFAANSGYQSTAIDGLWDKMWSQYSMGYGDLAYEYINNQGGIRDEIDRKASAFGADSGKTGSPFSERNYKHMTEDEVAVYNYYYNTLGKEKADEFLTSIQDYLNQRQAGIYYENMEGKPVLEYMFGVAAGLDQFKTGIKNLANFKDDYIPVTDIQYASGMVREDLADTGVKVLGHSLGQIGYDAVTTAANMAPSILASTLSNIIAPGSGAIVGAGMMGGSAAGNAYQEVLNMGYGKGEARVYSTLIGAAEAGLQYALGGIGKFGGTGAKIAKAVDSIDNGLLRFSLQFGGEIGSEALEEGLQEVLSPILKNVVLGADESINWGDVAYSALLGGMMGGAFGGVERVSQNAQNKAQYGAFAQDLVTEAMEINPGSQYAQKMQGKLDKGRNLSGGQISNLVEQNEAGMVRNDLASIRQAAENRLTELGETGDVQKIAAALAKQAAGESLGVAERRAVKNSQYGNRVANELNTKNIQGGGYSSKWAQGIGTDRINAEEYGSIIRNLEAEGATSTPVEAVTKTEMATTAPVKAITEESSATDESADAPVSIEKVAQKYGKQAEAVVRTYNLGGGDQSIAEFESAYQAAYDMGKAGVAMDYAAKSETTKYLTEAQREIAYNTGKDAATEAASSLSAQNAARANGLTGWKKGAVKGENVTVEDLKKTFNDTQNTAYKVLSTYAEATGIDIVLYKSEADADGNFTQAQGRYNRSDPGTIYIDINAGLSNIKSVDDLAKYTMLRTFSHEFTHFIENWNPEPYNEFRKVVFDTLTSRGENVDDLITMKQAKTGLDYDKASREVIAEAMTDILPDSNFMKDLAENHKSIFQELKEKLISFLENLKKYFNSLGNNRSREANALKQQVGDAMHYVENIVEMFDKIAVQAVENYQKTVATEEAVQEESTNEGKAEDRESFYRRSHEAVRTIRESKGIAAAYNPVVDETKRAGQTKRELQKLGIQVIVHKGLEANVNGTTKVIRGDATTLAGDVVFVRNSLTTDPVEAAGHEAYHFWKHTDARADYTDTVVDNIEFSSNAFVQFQKTIADAYFGDEVGIEDSGADKLVEEIYAYITGMVHNGDKNNIARSFLRDYNAVKASWDKLVAVQTGQEATANEQAKPVDRGNVSGRIGETEAEKQSVGRIGQGEHGELHSEKRSEAVQPVQPEKQGNGDLQGVSEPDSARGAGGELSEVQTGAEVSDPYTALAHDLSNYTHVDIDGIRYAVKANGKGGYFGNIKRLPQKAGGVTIENARATIYSSYTPGFATMEEAIADLVAVARNNKLLGEVKTEEAPTMSMEEREKAAFELGAKTFKENGIVPFGKVEGSKKLLSGVKAGGGWSVLEAYNKGQASEFNKEAKEVAGHGVATEHKTDEGTVQQPVLGIEAAPEILDGVQAETVQRGGEEGNPVRAGEGSGAADAGRNDRSDSRPVETDRARSTRDRVGGRVQERREITSEEQAARAYADEKGYKVKINKMSTVKGITQVDLYDKNGLPTFNPIIINEGSDWGKVKEAIDLREEHEKAKAEKLHEEVQQSIQEKSTVEPNGSNFVIGDSLDLPSGTKARTRANIDAIRLVKKLQAEDRIATAEEQVILSKYVGWGGLPDAFGKPVTNYATRKMEYQPVSGLEAEFAELKEVLTEEEYKAARESTKNAHYTSIEVIKAMYDGLAHLGFTGGRMLEPSSGVGNFVGAMPPAMSATVKSWTMVELDNITGQIAKNLYPHADVRIQGFEETNIPDGYMDVAIGNVPFGNYAIYDKHYPKSVTDAIHNYFFAKSLDKVRPGGIVMFITSSFTMNSRDSAVRKYIMQRADLLGAIRLPNTAFAGNAGTSVVTDILILKKRADRTEYSGEAFSEVQWQSVGGSYNSVQVNQYFIDHPEMVLGIPKLTRGMYSSNELTYDPYTDRGSLGDQIRKAMENIQGKMDYTAQMTPEKSNFAQQRAKKKSRKLKVENGVIRAVDENGNLEEVKVDQDTANRITGMVAVRDAYTTLVDALQQGVNDSEVKKLRKRLNVAYDAFVSKYGILNAPKNSKALNEFADRYSILSLENYNKDSRTATKTDIFTKNTVDANRTAQSAETTEDGLTISLNTTGMVDTALIARLTGQKVDSVVRQLIDQRLVFKDKNGNLIPAVQYLSGNVRAKLREMEGLVGIDKDYRNNVEALKAIVPETVPYTDIYVNPGATWIPASVYEDFVGHILKRYNHTSYRTGKKDFSVEYVPETNEYKVEINDSYAKMSAQNTQVWGESGKRFETIFENMLNGRRTNVYYKDADGKSCLDRAKTEAVAEKVEKLNEEFRSWLWSDESRRADMQELYNESYNALVNPKYSGKDLTVNGLHAGWEIKPHQKDAIARIINSGGNTLLAHRVGAGKTMEMAAAAMKLKQLGVIKKPMFVVPNNVVAQWGVEFKDYFPAANILVVGDKDMSPAERMTTINRIKNNDYDAVILAYTKFEKIQMTKAWRQRFYEEQIENIMFAINAEKEAAKGKGFSVKQLEAKRKQLENKVKKLTDKAKDEDGAMFEDLGVDALFVDEAHNFKNLEYTTRMNNVSGLGKADGSQRAFDLYTKVRYLQQLNGGRGIVFATATPVMNSMTEMYIMQRYLQPDTMKQLGIDNFDSWAKMFGEVVNALEISPSGSGYRLKQTFSKFKNIKALQQLFRSFTDVLTEVPGLKIPKMKGGKVQIVECQQSEFQENFMAELAKRAENVKNVDPSVDNMLKITSDGRKIAYSQRMIEPTLPYEEGGKIYKCCENVFNVWKESKANKGTQMIFCDMATPKGKANTKADAETDADEFGAMDTDSVQLYDDMKARLVKLGIPAKEIAFIHDAKNDEQKAAMARKMNDGTLRVLIGSTGKMGVGLNAQVKAVAIHHLDAPWRPGDIEQRDGRVFRQKNQNDEAYKFVYVTSGSFDSRLWDILERKQKFINQIMNGEDVGNEVEDTGEVTLSAAEVKAVASGSPLIMEQVALEKEISKLVSIQQAHDASVNRAKEKIVEDERNIAFLNDRITKVQQDIKDRKDTYSSDKKFSITIGAQIFTDKKDAGTALIAEAEAKAAEGEYTTIGKFAGFDLRVIKTKEGINGIVAGKQNYDFKTYPGNTTYGINHLCAIVEGLDGRLQGWETALYETENDLKVQKQLAAETFTQAEKLKDKRKRYQEVMDILNPPVEQTMAEDDVQEQSREYLEEESNDRGRIQRISDQEQGMDRGNHRVSTVTGKDRTNGSGRTGRKAFGELTKEEQQRIIQTVKDHVYNGTNFQEARQIVAAYVGKRASEMTMKDWSTAYALASERLYNDIQTQHPAIIENRYAFLTGRISDLIFDIISGSDGQFQDRSSPLTDRDVLELAANEIQIADLNDGEQSALQIFKDRLTRLQELQEQRAEQGRLYKEQQFGTNVDRAAAAETLNRMHILDGQIKAASAAVLDVEKKEVLGRVLKKARKIVEMKEREHGQEILQRYRDRRNEAAAIKKYRERIRKDVDELSKWVLHPDGKDALKHVPDALKNPVITFLTSIDMTSKQQLRGKAATKADEEFMERLEALQKALKNNIDLYGLYSGYNDLPEDFMDNLQTFISTTNAIVKKHSGEFVINQMTAKELHDLSKVVRTLKKYITQVNKFHVNAMFKHVTEAGDSSIEFLSQLKPAQNRGSVSNFLLWQQIRPAYAFERFGDGGKAIYDGLRRGQAALAFNTQKIKEFSEAAYSAEEVKAWEKEVKSLNLSWGTAKLTIAQMMGFYELSKQEDSLRHMIGQGLRVATFVSGKEKISDVGHQLTMEDINTVVEALTPRQKEVADKLQQYMAKQGGAWGNYVSVARFGEEMFGNPQYYPINSDGRHLDATAEEHPGNASLYALLNMSFTKSRNDKARNRIILYSIFDVFSNHMASMAQYNAFALPILDALKWFNYQQTYLDEDGKKQIAGSVREGMDIAYGVPEETKPGRGKQGYAESFVINIIKGFNGTQAQGTPYDALGMKQLHTYNRAQVAFNIRSVVQQPLAITRAALLLDASAIVRGLKAKPSTIKKNIDEMQKHSGIAAWKSLGFYDVNISRGVTSIIKHDETWMDQVTEKGLWMAEQADKITWAAIWNACKEQVAQKQHLKTSDPGFYEAATKLFEDVIYKTQVVDSVLTKNELMRDKGFWTRMASSFMSEPVTTASMLVDVYDKFHMDMQRGMNRQQAWQKNGKMIARTVSVYAIGAALLAAVQSAADAWRDDDDYQTMLEKWLEAFGGNLFNELNPLNKLVWVADAYDGIVYAASEFINKVFGTDIYANLPQLPVAQIAEQAAKSVEIFTDKILGENTDYTYYGGIYKMLQAVSGLTGAPMASVTREIISAWNNTIGAMAPSLKVKTYDPGDKAEMKYAYQDGYMTAEEAMQLLLDNGLAADRDEAYWIVKSWDGGSRYDAVYDAVLNGGDVTKAMEELLAHGYTEEEVIWQIKGQVKTWFKGGTITAERAIDLLVGYGDLETDDAELRVEKWAWDTQNPDYADMSEAAYTKYVDICRPAEIDLDVFYDCWKFYNDTSADLDKKGNAIPGTKKKKVKNYIYNLDLTAKQKRILLACWYD